MIHYVLVWVVPCKGRFQPCALCGLWTFKLSLVLQAGT